MSIRVLCFAFVLIGFGYLIQNENVNIFYTFTNPYLLVLARTLRSIGGVIVTNMPLIFLVSLVSKRANSGAPTVMAIVGYITYLIVTTLWTSDLMPSQVYANTLGISLLNNGKLSFPIQTGLLGAFIVVFATRISYLKSRRRTAYSLLAFTNKDTSGLIYNIILCAVMGVVVSLAWPFVIQIYEKGINWIAEDISNPHKLFVYGVVDRLSSIMGMGDLIREPFWYGTAGGTYQSVTGSVIVGDVNIWRYMPEAASTFTGVGRFITPYYVINMFLVPSIYLGMYFSYDDHRQRKKSLFFLIAAMLMSFICGNPLPLELVLLLTSPILLIMYLVGCGTLFTVLSQSQAFLGFNYSGTTAAAMPGSFADYIINIRTPQFQHTMLIILIVGIIFAIIFFMLTMVYYRYLAFDLAGTNKSKVIVKRIIDAVGGTENIVSASSGPFNLSIELKDLEAVSYEKIKKVGAKRVTETNNGLILDFCSASKIIKVNLLKVVESRKRLKG